MIEPFEIAVGHLQTTPDEPVQFFRLFLVSELAVELRDETTGLVQIFEIDILGGYEIAQKIAEETGCAVTFDYARSRLTWSGGLRPLQPPSGPLKTKLTPRRSRRLQAS